MYQRLENEISTLEEVINFPLFHPPYFFFRQRKAISNKWQNCREPSRFAGGALRRGWTSAKVWWNRDVVLGEKKYPTLTEDEVARLWGPARLEEHEDKFKFDFEDSYPSEPYYAYVW